MNLKKIIVPTDFSAHARAAYSAAAAFAEPFGASLALAHVMEAVPPLSYLHERGIETGLPQNSFTDEYKDFLQAEARRPELASATVTTKLVCNAHPHEGLNQAVREEGADLVFLGPHGHSTLGYAVLGSFATKAVRYARVPVLTYRSDNGAVPPRRILVPYDFSQSAAAVLPLARFLAEKLDARLTFLHVVESVPLAAGPLDDEKDHSSFMNLAERIAERARERFEKLFEEELRGVECDLRVRRGHTVGEILETARDKNSDLVLLSTHGWTGWKHLLLGSVAEKVVRKAPCSVLTVRPQA